MTTNKLQISGHPMGQELELPRPNFNRNYQGLCQTGNDCRSPLLREDSHGTAQTKHKPIQN